MARGTVARGVKGGGARKGESGVVSSGGLVYGVNWGVAGREQRSACALHKVKSQ